jgi:hypothetical protein
MQTSRLALLQNDASVGERLGRGDADRVEAGISSDPADLRRQVITHRSMHRSIVPVFGQSPVGLTLG